MKYVASAPKHPWPRRVLFLIVALVVLLVGSTFAVRYKYTQELRPVSRSQRIHIVTIARGSSVDTIATQLRVEKLIRSSWAFKLYVSKQEVRSNLQAGVYEFIPAESVPEIVAQLTHGKVATNLVTILPGQHLDQIKARLAEDGFSAKDIEAGLNPKLYANHPALVDKPASANLEGYIYPDSYQKTSTTRVQDIVKAALDQFQKRLTPDLRADFAKQGLNTYQAITLASIIEEEVDPSSGYREQVAQIFLKRLRSGMHLQSDVTAFYGALIAGQRPTVSYPSPYNTYLHEGLPPTPISNVSITALNAVAHPANTDWLYFVAGDDHKTTYFARTLGEHQANVQQYCKESCAPQ